MLIAGGFVLGAIGAAALRGVLRSQLVGITASDPFILCVAAALLVLVALAACVVPARRASRIDPIVALTD